MSRLAKCEPLQLLEIDKGPTGNSPNQKQNGGQKNDGRQISGGLLSTHQRVPP